MAYKDGEPVYALGDQRPGELVRTRMHGIMRAAQTISGVELAHPDEAHPCDVPDDPYGPPEAA